MALLVATTKRVNIVFLIFVIGGRNTLWQIKVKLIKRDVCSIKLAVDDNL